MTLKPCLVAFAALAACAAPAGSLAVSVDGKPIRFKGAQPMEIKNRLMVPMRALFEALGATLTYDPTTRTVEAHRGNEAVGLTFGSRIAKKNGAEIQLDVVPVIRADVTYVPLRFIAEALGAKLSLDKARGTLEITTAPATRGAGDDPAVTGGPHPDPLTLSKR